MLKEAFKYYKRRCPPPTLEEVIDFSSKEVKKYNLPPPVGISCGALGLTPSSEWKIYSLEEKPGFIFISNPFTNIGQRYWIYRCLKHYSRKPNHLNLDVHGDAKHGDWWSECQRDDEQGSKLMEKLRWATLGYHHNWDTKVYSENERNDFPEDLAALSREVAHVAGSPKFSAEAAIINYYHMDSTLSCHTDHSELNLDAPLLSFSFGQSAIFLLGGKSKEEKPLAIRIDSGDIVIMSGESRHCYHGVPLILPAKFCPWNKKGEDISQDLSFKKSHGFLDSVYQELENDDMWKPFEKYISTSRINMNVRQVLPCGQSAL
ncbi:nucleic acid dioxygenase ALKBH1 [Ischnura elegans]|uniref:nucleic acid dioxygenase ALKBH1 n=1 Tax=Ischnura elegans TaxID=197161 RepID=UPI001ED8AD16|nr:nucleic acid dioxygenase ALKBH1 [Ischnura elegans]